MVEGPLKGLDVLEIGDGAAAMAGRVLASLGASVTRVSLPGHDLAYPDARFPVSPRTAWYTLDKEITSIEPSELASAVEDFLPSTDLLIDGLEPGELAEIGLDEASLRGKNPGLVVLQLSHHGQDGPYRDWAGSALTDFALGGSLIRCGRASEAPLPPPTELADIIGGITGVLASLAVIAERKAGSGGTKIDCSVAESCVATSDWSIPIRSLMGTTTPRDGAGPLYPVYHVKDGWVRVLNLSPKQWQAFLEWAGRPDELAGEEWASLPYRAANPETIDLVFKREFGDRTREELFHEGQRAGVSVVPVYAPEDIAQDSHFDARKTLATVEFPDLGEIAIPRTFVRLGRSTIPESPSAPVTRETLTGPRTREILSPGLSFSQIRVVELGSGGVAPEATRHLALFGADVIKVEHLSAPDFMRTTAGPGMHEYTANWASSNRNKRSVEIDLKTGEGRRQMFELLSNADVFIENNSGGVCDRLGIGYEAISAINPRIVYCSSQIFGATGDASAYSGFGPSNHAASGLAHLWSAPDNPKPEGNQLVHPDHLAGKTLAIGAIAALINRQRTGLGEFVDLAQAEFAMTTIGEAFVEASLSGKAERRGQDHPSFAPHGVFPTLLPDEWVAIAVETDEHWQSLKHALGNPDWAQDETLDDARGRLLSRETIRAGVSAWTETKARPFIVNELQLQGIPAMQLLTPVEQLADPQLNDRGIFETLVHPLAGPGRFEGLPFRFEARDNPVGRRAPLLGEDTSGVLRDWLGEGA